MLDPASICHWNIEILQQLTMRFIGRPCSKKNPLQLHDKNINADYYRIAQSDPPIQWQGNLFDEIQRFCPSLKLTKAHSYNWTCL